MQRAQDDIALQRLAAQLTQHERSATLIGDLLAAFELFRAHAFQHTIGPGIQHAVNDVLSLVDMARPISLEVAWTPTAGNKDGHLAFRVSDGSVAPPFEKASGAQRFFTSLALRFAFARVGAARTVFTQLFIDEGFTSCDAETLDCVPALLRRLLDEWQHTTSIYLISHSVCR